MDDYISRQAAIDGLWKALHEYQDKTEKQFQDSEELDLYDWMVHRIFVQNMSDIDMQTILNLPSAQPERERGKWDTFFSDSYKVHKIGVECSCCGYRTQERTNYCPRCGADMRGEQNG